MQSRRLGDEGLADNGLPDQQYRSGIMQPVQAVEFQRRLWPDSILGTE